MTVWFLFHFFLAQDSLTATTLWKSSKQDNNNNPQYNRIQSLAKEVFLKRCQNEILNQPSFDKVLLIVIDALGSDFLPSLKDDHKHNSFGSPHGADAMPFLEGTIRQGQSMGFIARAATPTVTMPRIKALLSGTIPSFVDIVYNLASDVSKFDDDNILGLAKARNKSIVFYGDDTWLSLFNRNIFTRVKETFSFFASDYTSVDTNVTECALPESK